MLCDAFSGVLSLSVAEHAQDHFCKNCKRNITDRDRKKIHIAPLRVKKTYHSCDCLVILPISGLWSLEYKRELTSPLCIAAAQGFTECLQYLLEHGAHPNLLAGGKAALHEACVNANTECVELLLEHGANPNQITEEGLTALHLCTTPQSLR